MKHRPIRNCLRAARVALAMSAMAVLSASAGAIPVGTSEAVASAKTHTLFMGAEVSVERNKELFRVQDVSGGSLTIYVKGEPVFIPVGRGAINFKVVPVLKLASSRAVLEKFKYERAYTPMNDPVRNFVREQSAARSTAQSAAAHFNVYGAQQAVAQAHAIFGATHWVDPENLSDVQGRIVDQAERNAAFAETMQNAAFAAEAGQFNQTSTYTNRLQQEQDKQLFDAVEINFEVSAPEPLNRPYVVVMATFREADAKPSEVRKWIYAKELSPIDHAGRSVHFLQGGFPPGFELKDLQLHLYDTGREIPTSLSANQVALTRDEAFQYVLLEYLGSHKNATLGASPALGKLPADLVGHLTTGQGQPAYYVKVSKDGAPLSSYLDPACSKKVTDPYFDSLLHGLRFKPALENGKPVDGVACVKLHELLTTL